MHRYSLAFTPINLQSIPGTHAPHAILQIFAIQGNGTPERQIHFSA
jgi:hypothetical protein